MSVPVHEEGDTAMEVSHDASQDELSDVEVDGDGSSSLSDLAEIHPDEQDEDDDLSNDSEENDSEAETERLEDSPNKIRKQQDVVLSASTINDSPVYPRSPSKLKHQTTFDNAEEDEEEDALSEIEDEEDIVSVNESVKSSEHGEVERDESPTAATALEDSSSEGKKSLSVNEADSKKRKRSIMAGSGFDLEEPVRKRTGSVLTPGDEYAIEEDEHPDEEVDTSNPISGNISGDEGAEVREGVVETVAPINEIEEPAEAHPSPKSPKKRGRRKKRGAENDTQRHEDDPETMADEEAVQNGQNEAKAGDEEHGEQEADYEAEAAQRNEEELEKKRVAIDQLGAIERQFATFRERLYEERLEQLNKEEEMLRQDTPTHPEYLAMMQCIDARRDERLRISDNLRKYEIQTLNNYAVARRSQILVQYHQDVRGIREKKLEQLGKQWYEIQHDRRIYAGSVPDYTLKFPTKRSQQIMNQVAYNNEVSILSGVAKFVGFPAAPAMATATDAELTDDLEKMGRSRQPMLLQRQSYPLQELAGLRTSSLKPAEEQFIEQTPWANPQHPSHAHRLQRQASAQQTHRTKSPFSQSQPQPRRHSNHYGSGPISGTFSSNTSVLQHSNGVSVTGGQVSPHNAHNPFTNSHTVAPSPLGSRHPSLSPQQMHRPPPERPSQQSGALDPGAASSRSPEVPRAVDAQPGAPRDFQRDDLKTQAIAAMMTQF